MFSIQKLFLSITLLILVTQIFGQSEIKVTNPGVSINDNGENTPDPSAILDVNSSNKGVVFPRLTTEQRDAIESPIPGLLVFNTDNCIYEYFDGSNWQVIGMIPVQDAPTAPSNLIAEISGANQSTITWTDNSTNESGFEIWYRVDEGAFTFLETVASNTTNFIHSNLTEGIYDYQVRGTNGCAKGEYSNTSPSILNIDLSGAYMSLTARGPDLQNFVLNGSEISTWNDLSGNSRHMDMLTIAPLNNGQIGTRSAVDFQTVGTIVTNSQSDFNFLHQGNIDYTLLWVCDVSDRLGFGYNNNLASSQQQGSSTGINVVSVSSDLNHPEYAGSFLINIKNPSSVIHLSSGINTIKHDEVNVVVIRYEANSKTFYLTVKNQAHHIQKSASYPNVNFNQGPSTLPYRIGQHNSGGFYDEISEHHIWTSKLTDSEVDKLTDLFFNYYK